MTQVQLTRSWLRTPRRSCMARCGASHLAGTSHHHFYVHLLLGNTLLSYQFIRSQILNFPPLFLLVFESPLFVLNSSLPSRCQEKGSCKEGPRPRCLLHLHPPALAGRARQALPARTASKPRDTNPGEPRPLSPGNSCSASALEGMWKALVFPEAASGCHRHTYSKKG